MIRCVNCRTTWLGTPDDEAIVEDFLAHPCQTIAAASPSAAAAPLPTTHGSPSVERGMIASRAATTSDGADSLPARTMHPSARLAAIVPMFGGGVA